MNKEQNHLNQVKLYTNAMKRISDINRHFLEMLNHPSNPITKTDLKALILLRPEVWGRFKGFLDTDYRQD